MSCSRHDGVLGRSPATSSENETPTRSWTAASPLWVTAELTSQVNHSDLLPLLLAVRDVTGDESVFTTLRTLSTLSEGDGPGCQFAQSLLTGSTTVPESLRPHVLTRFKWISFCKRGEAPT